MAVSGSATVAGAPDADRLSSEALTLGQALGLGTGQLTGLFGPEELGLGQQVVYLGAAGA